MGERLQLIGRPRVSLVRVADLSRIIRVAANVANAANGRTYFNLQLT